MRDGQKKIVAALESQGFEVAPGKGGFFIRGTGWVSYSKAKSIAGIKGNVTEQTRSADVVLPYGDYGWIAALNGRMNG